MRTTQSFVFLALVAVGCGSSSSSPSDAAISEAGTGSETGSLVDAPGSVAEAGGTLADVAGTVSEAGGAAADVAASVAEAGGSASEAGGSALDGASAIDAGSAAAYCTSKSTLASMPDLSGTWVAKLTAAQIVNSPLIKTMHNQNIYYQLLTIQQTGNAVTIDGHYCDRTEINNPGSLAPVLIPDAWAHAETVIHRGGTVAASAAGYSVLNLSDWFEAIGANLASASDALPTAADDARVYDQDNDGQPGITIHLGGTLTPGNIYSVQSQITSIAAVAVSPTRLEGALTFTSKQTVLASNPSSIKSAYTLCHHGDRLCDLREHLRHGQGHCRGCSQLRFGASQRDDAVQVASNIIARFGRSRRRLACSRCSSSRDTRDCWFAGPRSRAPAGR